MSEISRKNSEKEYKKKALEIIERDKKKFFKNANVVGIAFGYKQVKNKTTNRPCIAFFVVKKLPIEKLSPDELLPEFLELQTFKIETDVIQTGYFKFVYSTNTSRHRPACPGISIGNSYRSTTGTFGAVVVENRTGNKLILSNHHILAKSNDAYAMADEYVGGDPIIQPGGSDEGSYPDDLIGFLYKFIPVKSTNPVTEGAEPCADNENLVDAALAYPTEDITHIPTYVPPPNPNNPAIGLLFAKGYDHIRGAYYTVLNNINDVLRELDIDFLTPNSVMSDPEVGTPVMKSGRTTGLTAGSISHFGQCRLGGLFSMGDPNVKYFNNCIFTTMLSKGGDSGSLVIYGKPCTFTQVFGLLESPKIQIIRNWRDRFITRIIFGRQLIQLYYFISSYLAPFVAHSYSSKKLIKTILNPLTKLLHRKHPSWVSYRRIKFS